jgi:hypothetical protein
MTNEGRKQLSGVGEYRSDVCAYVQIYICMYTHTHMYIHTYAHTYIYIYMHIHIYIYTYIYIHIHMCIGLPGSLETYKSGGQFPENLWLKIERIQSLGANIYLYIYS